MYIEFKYTPQRDNTSYCESRVFLLFPQVLNRHLPVALSIATYRLLPFPLSFLYLCAYRLGGFNPYVSVFRNRGSCFSEALNPYVTSLSISFLSRRFRCFLPGAAPSTQSSNVSAAAAVGFQKNPPLSQLRIEHKLDTEAWKQTLKLLQKPPLANVDSRQLA